ncbi:flagellar protein MotY [Ferrimonas marina]|uniref:OmpA family protein n=1 Tax=Ferrimonas marina TaxID=299255 RepID=A0A1M5P8X4_9GAMM|nr:OmpA family protein [Ferrimonas marina]SHG98157.1 OmpA family protein [Ferrimonas marina]
MIRWMALLLPMVASASEPSARQYLAPIEGSQWQLEQSTPLQCVLSHEIPRYGKAVFVSRANKELNLHFTLEMRRKPEALTDVRLASVAPAWRPGIPAKPIAELNYFSHFDGELEKQGAWNVLAELEQGWQPTFFYNDWHHQSPVSVGLSAANFGREYDAFVDCLDGLLPYGFEDIAFTVLHHDKEGQLTRDSLRQLERIVTFLSLDERADLVLLDAYTDSYRSELTNMALTRQQAEDLKDRLVAAGVSAERIVTQGHGEKRHIARNNSERERALNRRVTIRLDSVI